MGAGPYGNFLCRSIDLLTAAGGGIGNVGHRQNSLRGGPKTTPIPKSPRAQGTNGQKPPIQPKIQQAKTQSYNTQKTLHPQPKTKAAADTPNDLLEYIKPYFKKSSGPTELAHVIKNVEGLDATTRSSLIKHISSEKFKDIAGYTDVISAMSQRNASQKLIGINQAFDEALKLLETYPAARLQFEIKGKGGPYITDNTTGRPKLGEDGKKQPNSEYFDIDLAVKNAKDPTKYDKVIQYKSLEGEFEANKLTSAAKALVNAPLAPNGKRILGIKCQIQRSPKDLLDLLLSPEGQKLSKAPYNIFEIRFEQPNNITYIFNLKDNTINIIP